MNFSPFLWSKRRGASTDNAVPATKEKSGQPRFLPNKRYADSERTFHAAYRDARERIWRGSRPSWREGLFFGGSRYNQVKGSRTSGGPNGMTNAPVDGEGKGERSVEDGERVSR